MIVQWERETNQKRDTPQHGKCHLHVGIGDDGNERLTKLDDVGGFFKVGDDDFTILSFDGDPHGVAEL